MQYKIPVQVENEDPIFLGLSLRQLMIIMIGWGFAYMIFQSRTKTLSRNCAFIRTPHCCYFYRGCSI